MENLFLFVCTVLIGCSSYSKSEVDIVELNNIKVMYQDIVKLENQCPMADLTPLVDQMTNLSKGKDFEGGTPFWLIPQKDLLRSIGALKLTQEEHRALRLNFIKEFGLIAPMLKLDKSHVIETYICPTDVHNFTEEYLIENGVAVQYRETALLRSLRRYLNNKQ